MKTLKTISVGLTTVIVAIALVATMAIAPLLTSSANATGDNDSVSLFGRTNSVVELFILSELFDDNGDDFGDDDNLLELIILSELFTGADLDVRGERTVVVQSGDTLSAIAVREGTTVNAIVAANPNTIEDPDLIFPGEVLIIPTAGDDLSFRGGTSGLTELFTLAELFDDNGDDFGNGENIVELFILSELFVDAGVRDTGRVGIFGGGNALLELIILSELFDNNNGNNNGGDLFD